MLRFVKSLYYLVGEEMNRIKLLFITVFILGIVYSIFEGYKFLLIDNCLDSGNVWDYIKNICIEDNLSIQKIKCFSKRGSWDKGENICIFESDDGFYRPKQ